MNAQQRGEVLILPHTSDVLKGNALGDPVDRDLYCYLPPTYSRSQDRYPVIYWLSGFTGSGRMIRHHTNTMSTDTTALRISWPFAACAGARLRKTTSNAVSAQIIVASAVA